MKHFILLILAVLIVMPATAESLKDGGSGYDVGALRKADFRYYGGATEDPSFIDLGSNQIRVNACCVNLWNNASFEGYPIEYAFAQTDLTLNVNAVNYVVADYNGGSPVLKVITDVELITESDVVPILTIYDGAGILHSLNWDELGIGLPNKLHQRLVKTQRYQRESGLLLSMTNPGTNMSFLISSGRVWYGAKRQTVDAVSSTVDTILRVAPNGSTTVITALDNTNYFNGNTLTALTANRYAVNWVYRGIEEQKHAYIMLGSGDYTLSEAQAAVPPAAPALITSHAQLVAKVIVQKNNTTVTSIQSAFDQQFALSTTLVHNELTGLNDGDYKHLTAAQLTTFQSLGTIYAAIAGSQFQDFAARDFISSSVDTGSLNVVNVATFTGTVNFEGATVVGLPEPVAVHNDLSGLNDGDYQHLTAAEKVVAMEGSASQDFAADHISANTASITTALDIGSTIDVTVRGDGAGNVEFDYTGVATFTSDLAIEGDLSVGATADITITGDGNGNALFDYGSGVASFTGDLDVAGTLTIGGEDVIGDINAALAAILGE